MENPAGVKEPNRDRSSERVSLLANHLCYRIAPKPLNKTAAQLCQQATVLDLPFYDILVSQNVPLLKFFDDIIACDL